MAVCSYCQVDTKSTFEHLYSDTVLRAFDDIAPLTIDPIRGKVHTADPGQNDLCGKCNSGLSNADTYMGQLSRAHLKQGIDLGTQLNFDSRLGELWVLKTSANLERSANKNATAPWWHDFRDYFRHLDAKPKEADVFFAVWEDISPGLNPAQVIESKEAVLISEKVDLKKVAGQIRRAWAIKIGFGVFVMICWEKNFDNAIRSTIKGELKDWGWSELEKNCIATKIPFNIATSAAFYLLSNPDDIYAYKKLSELKD